MKEVVKIEEVKNGHTTELVITIRTTRYYRRLIKGMLWWKNWKSYEQSSECSYRGSGTVWRYLNNGTRCSTSMESYLADRARSYEWEVGKTF